jgi:hypothetical protein
MKRAPRTADVLGGRECVRTLQHTSLLCQSPHIRDFQIWLRLRWGRGAKTWLRVASVDPDSGQAERPGRGDVVVKALGDMQDFLGRHSDTC